MTTTNVRDYNTYNVPIGQGTDKKQDTNIDLAVQMVFLSYNQFMHQRTEDKLGETKDTLSEMNTARDMYARMKELKKQAGKDCSAMPDDMKKFLDDHNINYDKTGNDNLNDSDEWDINMSYLDSYIQKVSGTNKTQLLELNQCVEDGNNALKEVSTVFSKYSEEIQSVIQMINR